MMARHANLKPLTLFGSSSTGSSSRPRRSTINLEWAHQRAFHWPPWHFCRFQQGFLMVFSTKKWIFCLVWCGDVQTVCAAAVRAESSAVAVIVAETLGCSKTEHKAWERQKGRVGREENPAAQMAFFSLCQGKQLPSILSSWVRRRRRSSTAAALVAIRETSCGGSPY